MEVYQYRIQWKSLLTGYIGNGEWFDPKDKKLLEDWIEEGNKKHGNEFHHWLVTSL